MQGSRPDCKKERIETVRAIFVGAYVVLAKHHVICINNQTKPNAKHHMLKHTFNRHDHDGQFVNPS